MDRYCQVERIEPLEKSQELSGELDPNVLLQREHLRKYCTKLDPFEFEPSPPTDIENLNKSMPISHFDKFWRMKNELHVYLMGGVQEQRQIAIEAMTEWNLHSNLKFVLWPTHEKSQIRVSFKQRHGNKSFIGTDALLLDDDKPTMNLEEPLLEVALHEFGHALGLDHEHQHPFSGLKWNKKAVVENFQGIWRLEQIEANIFSKYDIDSYMWKDYDRTSIMHYEIPPRWLLSGSGVPRNEHISAHDIKMVKCLYHDFKRSKL